MRARRTPGWVAAAALLSSLALGIQCAPTINAEAALLRSLELNTAARPSVAGNSVDLLQAPAPGGTWGKVEVRSNRPGATLTVAAATPVGSSSDIRAALVADTAEFRALSDPMPLPDAAAGITLPLNLSARALQLAPGGTYPVALILQDGQEVLDTERFMLQVPLAQSDAPAGPAELAATAYTTGQTDPDLAAQTLDAAAASTAVTPEKPAKTANLAAKPGAEDPQSRGFSENPQQSPPTPVTILWPLSAPNDILPGETGQAPDAPALLLASETLGTALEPGGSVRALLDSYLAALDKPQLAPALCLAIDPDLEDTVQRMSTGYFVAAERPAPVTPQTRLRSSWRLHRHSDANSTPGAHADAAQKFLDDLAIARAHCETPLVFSNADIDAVAATHSQELAATATAAIRTAAAKTANLAASGLQSAQTIYPTIFSATGALSPEAAALFPASATPILPDIAPRPRPALTYPWALTATLADLSSAPQVLPFVPAELRFDAASDALPARQLTAAAALSLEISAGNPLLIAPPAAATAEMQTIFGNVFAAILAGKATPRPLAEALSMGLNPATSPHARELSDSATSAADSLSAASTSGTDNAPPSAGGLLQSAPTIIPTARISEVAQQAYYTAELSNLMVNDQKIALTREQFVAPLFADQVRALSTLGWFNITHSGSGAAGPFAADANLATRIKQIRDVLQQLRNSVSLVPPGNVFVRTSQATPITLIVRNGLPLPVEVDILVAQSAPTIETPQLTKFVPARGSIGVNFPLPHAESTSHETLYRFTLATASGQLVSAPIDVQVRTHDSSFNPKLAGLVGLALVTLVAIALQLRRRR